MRAFPCNISKCILEVIDFNCSFSGNVSYTDFNEIPSFGNKTDKEDNCIGKCVDHDFFLMKIIYIVQKLRYIYLIVEPAISVVLSLSCSVVGGLLGMGGLIVVQRFRKYKQR